MSDFSNRLLAAASKEEVDTSIVVCRYGLIDLCFTKLITYFYHFDKNIAMTFETIHDYIAESFQNMAEILKTSTDQTRLEVAKVVTRKEDLYKAEIKRLKAIQ